MNLRQTVHRVVLAAAVALLTPGATFAQTAIDVTRADGRIVSVTLADLPRHTVSAQDHGARTAFEGVLLRDVLAKAGVPLGEQLHGPTALASFVLATARDSYQAVFSIAELDAGFTEQVILLADRRDGKPLDAAPGDVKAHKSRN